MWRLDYTSSVHLCERMLEHSRCCSVCVSVCAEEKMCFDLLHLFQTKHFFRTHHIYDSRYLSLDHPFNCHVLTTGT